MPRSLNGEKSSLFGFSEILHRVLGNSVQFRYIDVRLLYVVIIGSIYGLNEGVAAAFSGSLVL